MQDLPLTVGVEATQEAEEKEEAPRPRLNHGRAILPPMSGDCVGLVRRAYETWNREGPAAIASLLAEDAEVHDAPELPDAQVWQGREAVIGRLQAVADAVGGGYVEFEGFEPRGDAVLVTMLWELGSEGRHAELGRVFHLVDTAGSAITRIRVFLAAADVPAD